jgi:hypothetical protein
MNRRPWPYMIEQFDALVRRYNAGSAHDATGLGNVVHDFLDDSVSQSLKVKMIGQDRTRLLAEYVTAFEQGEYRMPLNPPAVAGAAWTSPHYEAHRSTTVDEVWGTARWDSHLPDEVASCALMHRAAERAPIPAPAQGVAKTEEGPKSQAPLTGETSVGRLEGQVLVIDDPQDPRLLVPAGPEPRQVEPGVFRFD